MPCVEGILAVGKQKQRQEASFVTVDQLSRSAGRPFFRRLNLLRDEFGFDR